MDRTRNWTAPLFLGAMLVLPFVSAAHADAIDGDWCFPDGRRFSIRGPEIVTPGGTRMTGDYSRHFFSYVVPTAEPGAGQTVNMTLLNEQTVQVRMGQATEGGEIWKRCSATISRREGPASSPRG
jgi:hypothetical protein